MPKGKDSRKLVVCAIIFSLVSVSVAPSIYAEINNQQEQTTSENNTFDYDRYNPIQLVFLLIQKLRDYQNLLEIEEDEELNSIIEELKSLDCGCDDKLTIRWRFPIICLGLLYLYTILWCIEYTFIFAVGRPTDISIFFNNAYTLTKGIASELNCIWA